MSLPRSAPGLVAIVVVGALLTTLAVNVQGEWRETSPPPPLEAPTLRSGGDISSFEGMGTWIDIYDSSWSSPRASVAEMASRGVRTLYLETSNFNRSSPFVYPNRTERFLDAAHDHGMRVVAWYLPGFVDEALDFHRSIAAVRFRTARGNAFDGFGLDIESPEVRDPAVRSRRLIDLSNRLRDAARDFPLGAIIASPRGMERNPSYWPGFPYADLAAVYDVFLPMTYYSWRVSGSEGAREYATRNILIIRREVGSDRVPIHVIGGIANESTDPETRGFVRAVREHGIIGASFYTFPYTAASEWPILHQIPANPVQTPALPAPLGATEMGNIPGGDVTHPHDVAYRIGGRRGGGNLEFDAFDVQAREVQVYVNWELLATVQVGPAGDWTGPRMLAVPNSLLRNGGGNVIVFAARGAAPEWGVRAVSLAPRATSSPSTTSAAPPGPA